MRAAIYNPYWDSLGGGERYTISFARVLADNGYKVDIEWKNKDILQQIRERFNSNIDDLRVIADIGRGDKYDLCFWVSDGSIPLLRSRNNILHFQFPFKNVNGSSLYNRAKMFRIKQVVVNSKFTKMFIDNEYKVDSTVIYPPVDVENLKPGKKQNIILYVGRFSQLTQKKNQHILVMAFKKFINMVHGEWKLILAGGVGVGTDKDYFNDLINSTEGYNVEIIKNPSFNNLRKLYRESKIFWSASGLGKDEQKEPLKVEHFGMTVVEAMASGCIVFVSNIGGHKEIVRDGQNGFLWNNTSQLATITKSILDDHALASTVLNNALNDCKKYSLERFAGNIQLLL